MGVRSRFTFRPTLEDFQQFFDSAIDTGGGYNILISLFISNSDNDYAVVLDYDDGQSRQGTLGVDYVLDNVEVSPQNQPPPPMQFTDFQNSPRMYSAEQIIRHQERHLYQEQVDANFMRRLPLDQSSGLIGYVRDNVRPGSITFRVNPYDMRRHGHVAGIVEIHYRWVGQELHFQFRQNDAGGSSSN